MLNKDLSSLPLADSADMELKLFDIRAQRKNCPAEQYSSHKLKISTSNICWYQTNLSLPYHYCDFLVSRRPNAYHISPCRPSGI